MASGASSLESNDSTESITHSYVSNDRHNTNQIQNLQHSIEYDVLSSNQCYDKQNYSVKSHGAHSMSAPYDSLGQYDVMNKQTNENLKLQCEKALHDLNQLRRQHTETSRRCEHVMKELEYFRGQHRAAMTQLEASAAEASTLRGKYGDLLNDNQRLEREVQHLQQSGTSEGSSDALVHTLRKYDGLKEEFDCFQKRYDDLIENHDTTLEKLRTVQEENSRLKTQCHELTQERNAIIRERNALKQQLASVVRQCGASRDLKRLTDERNAALAEYTLIMSERDTVHKEMDKLSDELQAAMKRVAALESALQASRQEQTTTALQAESLRREIESALAERDRAIKECSDLRTPTANSLAKSRVDGGYGRLRLSHLQTDGLAHSDSTQDTRQGAVGEALDKEHVENLEQASQQIQRLRKHADTLQAELVDAQREAEVSKRRRDWAFSERDKLLQERESVKALCNRLRKERDQMVGELADARRHGNKISSDERETRGRSRSIEDKEKRHSTQSRDSSIEMDWQDYEWQIVETTLEPHGGGAGTALGFELDSDAAGNITVTSVDPNGLAAGKLRPGDVIVQALGVSAWPHAAAALCALRAALAARPAPLALRRAATRAAAAPAPRRALQLCAGIFIAKLGGATTPEGLSVGDRVLSINNRSMDGKSVSEAMSILSECQYDVPITVARQACCHEPINKSNYRVSLYSTDSYSDSSPLCGAQPEDAVRPFVPDLRDLRDHHRDHRDHRDLHDHDQHDAKIHIEHGMPDLDRRYVYNLAGSQGKIHQERGTWDMIRGKIEAVTGRSKSKDKQNKVPESDAIAELDSVIESYHGKSAKDPGGVMKRSRRKNKEEHDVKNGGTWPKARANFLHEQLAATTVQARAPKSRPALSILLSPPTKLPASPPTPAPVPPPPAARHSLYCGLPPDRFPKPAPLALLDYPARRSLALDDDDYRRRAAPLPAPVPSNPRPPSALDFRSKPYYRKPDSDADANYLRAALEDAAGEGFSHAHNMSELGGARRSPRPYEGGTFPRKKEHQRFRVPSNPSVTSKTSAGRLSSGRLSSGRLSSGSLEPCSERASPLPSVHVEVLAAGVGGGRGPRPGELRRVHIDKSQQPLGIQIRCPAAGGVFVATVGEASLAAAVPLRAGDQLLEVCGINMRSATYSLAASVLRQIGNSITMLVQYSPDKCRDDAAPPPQDVDDHDNDHDADHDNDNDHDNDHDDTEHDADTLALTPRDSSSEVATLSRSSNKHLPRFLLIDMRNSSNLGISLVGGNAVGIFVHSVARESPAAAAGLLPGDQLLEYNHVDLRRATAEQAALELAKPAHKVGVLVRHDLEQYHEIKDKPGDAFYIQASFDRCSKITSTGMDTIDEYSLWFRKDEVLFVDNTLFNGTPGLWCAWQLDSKGVKRNWGTIPSRFKVEEILRRAAGALEMERRASSSARRSFFRRKKPHSKHVASFANCELGCWALPTAPHSAPSTYTRVHNTLHSRRRPLVVLGPLRDSVVSKLLSDWPGVFAADASACPDLHCILDISVSTIEKLHKQEIYPIVLLIKFKSFKQIKEVKDTRFPSDKVSAKAAKEMYEHGLKVESEYRDYITAEIPAGINIAYMCTQIKEAVEEEQNKILWVPTSQA